MEVERELSTLLRIRQFDHHTRSGLARDDNVVVGAPGRHAVSHQETFFRPDVEWYVFGFLRKRSPGKQQGHEKQDHRDLDYNMNFDLPGCPAGDAESLCLRVFRLGQRYNYLRSFG